MNIIDKIDASTPATNPAKLANSDRFRLRRFVESLAECGELETREEPVDLADVAEALEGNPRAVLFRAVGPERQELVGSVTGSRARIARAVGVAPCAASRTSSRSHKPRRRPRRSC